MAVGGVEAASTGRKAGLALQGCIASVVATVAECPTAAVEEVGICMATSTDSRAGASVASGVAH